jgi:hypothetical protein
MPSAAPPAVEVPKTELEQIQMKSQGQVDEVSISKTNVNGCQRM